MWLSVIWDLGIDYSNKRVNMPWLGSPKGLLLYSILSNWAVWVSIDFWAGKKGAQRTHWPLKLFSIYDVVLCPGLGLSYCMHSVRCVLMKYKYWGHIWKFWSWADVRRCTYRERDDRSGSAAVFTLSNWTWTFGLESAKPSQLWPHWAMVCVETSSLRSCCRSQAQESNWLNLCLTHQEFRELSLFFPWLLIQLWSYIMERGLAEC